MNNPKVFHQIFIEPIVLHDPAKEAIEAGTGFFKFMGFGEVLSLGAFVVTAVGLAFALLAVIKEVSHQRIERRMTKLEARIDTEISGLRLGLVIEEICGKYVLESAHDRVSEVQTIRVQLFRIIYSSKQAELIEALIELNGFANPFYKEFFFGLREFYMATWSSNKWHQLGLKEAFRREFLETFDEDIDAAVANSYLWEYLRRPARSIFEES